MAADPRLPAPDAAQPEAAPSGTERKPVPTAPMTGHAATDTAADAADQSGKIRATRRVPEPDSLGG